MLQDSFAAPIGDTRIYRFNPYPTGIKPFVPNIEGPHNEVGFDEAVSYVSDLSAYWAYSSLHYYRLSTKGNFGARVNSATRFDTTAVQYEIDAYPTLSKDAYAALNFAYANQSQILFASYQYRAEGYFTLPQQFELSLGQAGQIYPQFGDKKIFLYTGSFGKNFGNYFLWIRPYYYTPESNQFYEIGIRKTFSDPNNYVTLRINAGHLPDIGDLPPLDNLITLRQEGIALGGQLSLKYGIFLKGGVEYDHQVYPSNLIRNITTGNLSIFIRF